MSLFELDSGRLVPAQFGRTVPTGLTEEILESIRSQVLEIIARPLFPITWRDMSRQNDSAFDVPRLTALDATGQVVSVEVLEHLTSDALINSLSRLADTAALSWTDLALEYPGGVPAFRSGWLLFRDSMPPSPGAGPRLIMVVGTIDPAARAALEVLTASGVEVHEISYRQMSNGRTFLDVNPVGPRVYAHTPQILSTGTEVTQIESGLSRPSSDADSDASSDIKSTDEASLALRSASVEGRRHAGFAVAPVTASSADAGLRNNVVEKSFAVPQTEPTDVKESKEAESVEPAAASVMDEEPREYRRSAPVYPRVRRTDAERELRPSSLLGEEPLFPSRRERRVSETVLTGDNAANGETTSPEAMDEVAWAHAAHEAAAYSSVDAEPVPIPARSGAEALGRDFVALQAMAVVVGDDTALYVRPSLDAASPMEFASSGHIRVGTHEFTDPNEALAANGVSGVDAWEELRLSDPYGPSLADALRELNVDIARHYQAKH